jgi:hypothetical protein
VIVTITLSLIPFRGLGVQGELLEVVHNLSTGLNPRRMSPQSTPFMNTIVAHFMMSVAIWIARVVFIGWLPKQSLWRSSVILVPLCSVPVFASVLPRAAGLRPRLLPASPDTAAAGSGFLC